MQMTDFLFEDRESWVSLGLINTEFDTIKMEQYTNSKKISITYRP